MKKLDRTGKYLLRQLICLILIFMLPCMSVEAGTSLYRVRQGENGSATNPDGFFHPKIQVRVRGPNSKWVSMSPGECGKVKMAFYAEPRIMSLIENIDPDSGNTDVMIDEPDTRELNDNPNLVNSSQVEYPTSPVICAYAKSTCNETLLKALVSTFIGIGAGILTFVTVGAGAPIAYTIAAASTAIATGASFNLTSGSMGRIGHDDDGLSIHGCYRVPIGPPPPPFCRVITPPTPILIVPVQTDLPGTPSGTVISTRSAPKLKFVVGERYRTCDSGSVIRVNQSCADGSRGTVSSPASTVGDVSLDGDDSALYIVRYEGADFHFKTAFEDGQICGKYYENGFSDSTGNTARVETIKTCWPLPDSVGVKPTIRLINSNIRTPEVELDIPGVGRRMLIYGATPLEEAGVTYKLTKPRISDLKNIFYNPSCSNGGHFSSQDGCPDGEEIVVNMYEDNNSNAVCVSGWAPDEEPYYLQRDNDLLPMISINNPYVLVRPSADSPDSINSARYSIGIQETYIYDLDQEILDTIEKSGNDAIIFTEGTLRKTYRRSANAKALITTLDPTTNYGVGSGRYVHLPPSGNTGGSGVYVIASEYRSIKGDAIALRDNETNLINNIHIANPYVYDMCLFLNTADPANFDYADFTIPTNPGNDTEYSVPARCTFVTVEAWGGGSSGHIIEDETKIHDLSVSGQALSGTSGSYGKISFKNNDNNRRKIKMKVGNGADGRFNATSDIDHINRRLGSSTQVQICNNDDTECKLLIYASGGTGLEKSAMPIVGHTSTNTIESPSSVNNYRTMDYVLDFEWINLMSFFHNSSHVASTFGINGITPLNMSGSKKLELFTDMEPLGAIVPGTRNPTTVLLGTNSPLIFERGLIHRDIRFGYKGMISSTSAPHVSANLPYINDSIQQSYVSNETSPCNDDTTVYSAAPDSAGIRSLDRGNNSLYPGMGGCANAANDSYQKGTHGKVRVTCEQWRR